MTKVISVIQPNSPTSSAQAEHGPFGDDVAERAPGPA
jgi:hypothetical protein